MVARKEPTPPNRLHFLHKKSDLCSKKLKIEQKGKNLYRATWSKIILWAQYSDLLDLTNIDTDICISVIVWVFSIITAGQNLKNWLIL